MIIRPLAAGEENFIICPWHRNLLAYHDDLSRDIVDSEVQPRIRNLMAKATVMVAADPECDLLIGGIVYERIGAVPVLHFAYTRRSHRRLGAFRKLMVNELLVGAPLIASISTGSLKHVEAVTGAPVFFNPFLFTGVQK
jgi:hypothetical protein